ncbi:MAG: hypothetical protein KDK12_05475 [Rhodobacteraceae bacterium]|nr:hypothetical protein [Paracoccaceae bacterium]
MRQFVFVPLLVLLAAPVPAQTVPDAMIGRWAGTGVQNGETWTVDLDMRADGASVWYPSLPCAARWIFGPSPQPGVVVGLERVTDRIDLCIDGLDVRVAARAKGGLHVEWLDGAGGLVATADLSAQ